MQNNLFPKLGFDFLKMRRIIIVLLVFISATFSTQAQILDMLSNPQITINILHPPTIGLKVSKIAFGRASGECSDQIINSLISDFTHNNIEVLDRPHLSTFMTEHHFKNNDNVDRSTAASIGKLLGPSAMIYVRVQRCAIEQDQLTNNEQVYDSKTKKNTSVKVFISRTRAYLKASIQTVDLATGRTFVERTLDFSPEKINKSAQGFPEYPAKFDVQDIAFNMFVHEVHRMFIPWNEPSTLYFYDDKDCGLKLAYQALKNNDLEQALTLSQQAMENCKNTPGVKEKILEHANYNMGMCYMIFNDYEKALNYLREAAKLRPGSIVNDAITSCLKSRDLAAAMQQIDDQASAADANNQIKVEEAVQKEADNTLTNADVISLTKQKLSKGLIIQKIKSSKCKFDTSSKALVALSKAGVSEDVISVMMDRK